MFSNFRAGAGILALVLATPLAGCNSNSGVASSSGSASGSISRSGSTTTSGSTSTGSSTTTSGSTSTGSSTSAGSTSGSATLSWLAPVTNTDGSALTNLAGYHIRYGTDVNKLGQVINISTTGLTTYVVDNLATGTYYFAVTSYTTAGVESALSGIVTVAV